MRRARGIFRHVSSADRISGRVADVLDPLPGSDARSREGSETLLHEPGHRPRRGGSPPGCRPAPDPLDCKSARLSVRRGPRLRKPTLDSGLDQRRGNTKPALPTEIMSPTSSCSRASNRSSTQTVPDSGLRSAQLARGATRSNGHAALQRIPGTDRFDLGKNGTLLPQPSCLKPHRFRRREA
jgi:hypothetical protein